MHTIFALLCFVVVIHWLIFPYPSGLLHWHWPAKQPWWIWINTSCEFIMNDCITTTKQSTTKPYAYFLGYTVSQISLQLREIISAFNVFPICPIILNKCCSVLCKFLNELVNWSGHLISTFHGISFTEHEVLNSFLAIKLGITCCTREIIQFHDVVCRALFLLCAFYNVYYDVHSEDMSSVDTGCFQLALIRRLSARLQ